jgi:hypothetical protein
MPQIPVYNLTLVGPQANPSAVSFTHRPPASHPVVFPIRVSDVLCHHPLYVKLTVPPGCRVQLLQPWEGRDIVLVEELVAISILQSE